MHPVNLALEGSGAGTIFEILDKDTQTNEDTVKNTECPSKSYKLPLPRELEANGVEIKAFALSQVLQDPGCPNSIAICNETITVEVNPDSNSACNFSNRYRYCKEVIKPYLRDKPPDCLSCKELLLKNALIKVTTEFPDNRPYNVCNRCPPPPCPPKCLPPPCPPKCPPPPCPPKCPPPQCPPKPCCPQNHLKICCGKEGEPTICKECTKQICPSFNCPKPYIPPCSPPLPCPPVCRPPCPLPACPRKCPPPPCPPPPCPPPCPPPPCPRKCPPPPCPPKCSPPPCPPKCPPPPCPQKSPPPSSPTKYPSPPCGCSGPPKSSFSQLILSIKSMTGLVGESDCKCKAKNCLVKPPSIPPECRTCPESRSERKFRCPNTCPNARNISNKLEAEKKESGTCSCDDMPSLIVANHHVIATLKCAMTDLMCKAFKTTQEATTALKSESARQLASLKNSTCISNSKNPDCKNPKKVNNAGSNTSGYNVVNLDTSEVEEKVTALELDDSEMQARSKSPSRFIIDKTLSVVSMISESLVFELPRPLKSSNDQNSNSPRASEPPIPTDIENRRFSSGSSRFFSSIQEIITSMFTSDDETTISSGRSSPSTLANESDDDLLSRLID